MAALQLEGMAGYGGAIRDKDLELPIHLPPRYNSEADVAEQIIFAAPGGAVVRVRDVARVVKEYDVDQSYVEADGQRAVVVSMWKNSTTARMSGRRRGQARANC